MIIDQQLFSPIIQFVLQASEHAQLSLFYIFNGLLSGAGYVEPELVDGITVAAAQSEAVKSAITFSFVGLEVITGIFLAGLLVFLNVEKDIAAKQAEIAARREK